MRHFRVNTIVLYTFIFYSLITLLPTDTIGQVLSGSDLNELSKDDVSQIKEKVLSSGLSISQLEELAVAKGYSQDQIEALKQKIYGTDESERNTSEPDPSSLPREYVSEMPLIDEQQEEKSDVYGASIFENKYLDFAPSYNIATPENYVLGPGDNLIIDIWGNAEAMYEKQISPEGSIKISDIGPIYLNGLSILHAKTVLERKLKTIYQSLGSSSSISLSIGELRTIKVAVVGEVNRPGSYFVSSLASLINVLYLAGGPNDKGSYRNIYVQRGGKRIGDFDLYEYLQNGSQPSGFLQDQDVVYVPTYANRIYIQGEVKRVGTYELLPAETIGDLLKLTGGFSEDAYSDKISIERNNRNGKSIVTAVSTEFDETELKNGDKLEIKKISEFYSNRIQIEGAVYQPGSYELKKGMMLSELINMAEGPLEEAFMSKGIITRKELNFKFNTISFNLEKVLKKEDDIKLHSEDIVKINFVSEMKEPEVVRIEGAILNPGAYDFTDSLSLDELIFLAGGFKKNAHLEKIEISRRITLTEEFTIDKSAKLLNIDMSTGIYDNNQEEFILRPFDIVTVRFNQTNKAQPVVTMEGEVMYPGKYVLDSKESRISDIFKRAGGITPYAFINGATLIRYSEYSDNDTKEWDSIRKRDISTILKREDSVGVNNENTFLPKEAVGFDIKKAIENPRSKFDHILKDGDILSVPKRFQTIQIRGEVMKPGKVEFLNNGSIKKHLGLAGGQTGEAKMSRVFLVRANGQVKRTKSFLGIKTYPEVEAGSEIFVPARPERRKVAFQEVLAITGSLLSIILIVDRL